MAYDPGRTLTWGHRCLTCLRLMRSSYSSTETRRGSITSVDQADEGAPVFFGSRPRGAVHEWTILPVWASLTVTLLTRDLIVVTLTPPLA